MTGARDRALALEISGLTVRYAETDAPALEGVSLALERGERVALLGENGSGKTTLLLTVVGLVPFSGVIRVAGLEVRGRNLEQVRSAVGFLFSVADDQILFPRVIDDAMFGLRGLDGRDAEHEARQMLERLGIAHLAERSPHHLSLGQRKRVALAGALVTGPELLLLDEPGGGLDHRGRRELVATLGALDGAVLLATHDLELACRCCDRAVVLREGRVALEATIDRAAPAESAARLLAAMDPRTP
jgi:cobalt/nickel transport system ATP-binding protein